MKGVTSGAHRTAAQWPDPQGNGVEPRSRHDSLHGADVCCLHAASNGELIATADGPAKDETEMQFYEHHGIRRLQDSQDHSICHLRPNNESPDRLRWCSSAANRFKPPKHNTKCLIGCRGRCVCWLITFTCSCDLPRPSDATQRTRLMHWLGWYEARALNSLRTIHANPKAAGVRKGFDDPIPTTGTTAD